ncbi:MAG: MerR family DNA-binding transcriptional regulator [Solirubrobacterales bacterium]
MDATLTISDAAAQSGISAHTLRYWERIRFLTKLRATGMPIRRIHRYAELLNGGDDTNEERLALLEEHREAVQAHLEETTGHLDLIEWKIGFYRERLGKK